jgi:hypothetical protein
MSKTARLEALGFDKSKLLGPGEGIRVGCSQCEAVCINGAPCHETGCPNATKECKGCGEVIPARRFVDYCGDCL